MRSSATSAQLNTPWTVSVGIDNSLYIADLSNNRVRKVSGGVISTVAGTGSRSFGGDGGAATAANLNDPTSVILNPAGDLYIADSGNNRVRKVYASTGIIETVTGNDSEQFAGDGGPANQASLYAPYALFFDQSGNLFLADTLHNRIRRILATPVALAYPVMRVGKTSAPQAEGLENDGNFNLNLQRQSCSMRRSIPRRPHAASPRRWPPPPHATLAWSLRRRCSAPLCSAP
jgi:hypothetical protein